MSGENLVPRMTTKPLVFRSTIDAQWYVFQGTGPAHAPVAHDAAGHLGNFERHPHRGDGFKEGPFPSWQAAVTHAQHLLAWRNDFDFDSDASETP